MLDITYDGKCLSFTQIPIYLGVKLDSLLAYHLHLESLSGKLTSQVILIGKIAGLGWDASAAVFQ